MPPIPASDRSAGPDRDPPAPRRPVFDSRGTALLSALGGLLLGGALGIAGTAAGRPAAVMAPSIPTAIHDLAPRRIGTIHGTVSDRFGRELVLADPTGRALVDLGPGADTASPRAGDVVSVQGRLDRGVFHAAFLVTADDTVLALGPLAAPPPPPPGPPGAPFPPGPGPVPGPGPDHGPDYGHDHGPAFGPGAPPVPGPAPGAAPPAAPAAAPPAAPAAG